MRYPKIRLIAITLAVQLPRRPEPQRTALPAYIAPSVVGSRSRASLESRRGAARAVVTSSQSGSANCKILQFAFVQVVNEVPLQFSTPAVSWYCV